MRGLTMSNFNFNKVILGGRLTADPELKTTPAGVSVTSFNLAVNRQYKPKDGEAQADFISCVAWRGTAEFITRFFRKGSSICVIGSIKKRTWTDDKGGKRMSVDIVADEALFVDAKGDGAASQAVPGAVPQSYMPDAYSAPNLEPIGDDEDLPF